MISLDALTEPIDFAAPPPGVFIYRAQTHFDQLDAQWLLHHSRYPLFLERAYHALFFEVMEAEAFDHVRYPDLFVVVRRLELDYLAPLSGVRPFLVALRVRRLREAALTVGFEFRSEEGDELFASGLRTVCKLNPETREPTGWSAEFRTSFERWVQWGKELES